MINAEKNNTQENAPASELSLWLFLLVPPIVWALQLTIGYALTPFRCYGGTRLPIYFVTAVALFLSLLSGVGAFFNWKRIGMHWPNEASGTAPHIAFMSVMALLGSGQFSIVIIASLIAVVMLHPCWR